MKKGYSYFMYVCCIIGLLFFSTNDIYSQKKSNKTPKKKVEVTRVDTTQVITIAPGDAPVSPFRDTLFTIYGNIGSFTAKQRAVAINERIVKLEKDPLYDEDSLRLVEEHSGNINIVYRGGILLSVDTLQAKFLKTTRTDLAQSYLDDIADGIQRHRDDTKFQRISIQIGSTIVIVVLFVLVLKFIFWAYRRLRVSIRLERGKRVKGIFGLIEADRMVFVLIFCLKAIRLLLIIITLYWTVWALFKIYPSTMGWADLLLSYVEFPLKKMGVSIISYLPNFFTVGVIIVVFRYVQKLMRSFAQKVHDSKITIRNFYSDWAFPTYNIVSVILYVFMFILIFPYLPKADSTIFQGVSVFVGLIISLGSTSVIGNLVAGLVITYMRPFRIGDRIKMDDCVGNVVEKTALVTRVKTIKNELITIPNSSVMNSKTINYSLSARKYGLVLYTNITIGYDVPWTKVHELLLEVAERTEFVSNKQKPFILQEALDEFYVSYQLNVYTREADKMSYIYSELHKHVQDVFGEAGIDLLSPHYSISKSIDEVKLPKRSGVKDGEDLIEKD